MTSLAATPIRARTRTRSINNDSTQTATPTTVQPPRKRLRARTSSTAEPDGCPTASEVHTSLAELSSPQIFVTPVIPCRAPAAEIDEIEASDPSFVAPLTDGPPDNEITSPAIGDVNVRSIPHWPVTTPAGLAPSRRGADLLSRRIDVADRLNSIRGLSIQRALRRAPRASVGPRDFLNTQAQPNYRGRIWFFTSFEVEAPSTTGSLWCVYQQEETQSGRTHWQGVVGYSNVTRRSTALARLGSTRIHLEPVRNVWWAISYVMKERTRVPGVRPVISGRLPVQPSEGIDNDWWVPFSICELWRFFPNWMLRHHGGVTAYHKAMAELDVGERPTPKVYILWGKPGTGKTYAAQRMFPGKTYYVKSLANFWDGYTGQEVVIFDDFNGDEDCHHIFRWTSGLPLRVSVKGSSVQLRATIFIFTMNEPWRTYFPANKQEAMHRRLTRVFHMKHRWSKPTADL